MNKKQMFLKVVTKYSTFFKIIFILSLVILMTDVMLQAQNRSNPLNELDVIHSQGAGGRDNVWIEFSDAQNSLYHYISAQAYPMLEKRAEEIAGYTSLTDWQKRQEWLRAALKEAAGL